jgi:hypothetical protein
MPRLTIQQFRAALAARSGSAPLARAYGELARRPELAATLLAAGWIPWDQTAASAAKA